MGSWAGQSVVVVGANGGIGSALAELLEDLGSLVHRLDLSNGFDATDRECVNEWFSRCEHIDTVFFAAGIAETGLFGDLDAPDKLASVLSVNVQGAVNVATAAAPQLAANNGRFVTLNSAFSLVTARGFGAYSASKSALSLAMEGLRPELAPATVTDCILGGVRTDIFASAAARDGTSRSQEVHERFIRTLGRRPPRRAAHDILKASRKRKPRPPVGVDAAITVALHRIAPRLTQAAVTRLIDTK